MMIEWRIRVCDGFQWSPWSPSSPPRALIPPLPTFTTGLRLAFSSREPTIAHLSWGACVLPEEMEMLSPSVEYMVFLTSNDGTEARQLMQVCDGPLPLEGLDKRGIALSEGTCGVLSMVEPEEASSEEDDLESDTTGFVPTPRFNFDDVFSETKEQRVVGRLTQSLMKPIHLNEEGTTRQVKGFEFTVSGLKPETIHRLSVVARCSTTGLDAPDWQRVRLDPDHPLRWTEPLESELILTPRTAPPMLPEVISMPEGRFGRFRHTPCLLLKCEQFRKVHADDQDKDHPVVIEVKPEGVQDDEFVTLPLSNSVYCDVEGHGPCRLVHNLRHLHAQLRIRNTVMNSVSAPTPPVFTLSPLPLESRQGPTAELICTEDGHLFVQLTWTVRCLKMQKIKFVQFSLRRHSVEAETVELQALEVTQEMFLEEIPPNAVLAAEEFEELQQGAEKAAQEKHPGMVLPRAETSRASVATKRIPFVCRLCCRRLEPSAPDPKTLGPFGRARLEDARGMLQDGALWGSEVPAYRVADGEDDLRFLRVPHNAEVEMAERVGLRDRSTVKQRRQGPYRGPKTCLCNDIVVRKALPVDGHKIAYGSTYCFRVRVRDDLTWSQWTEFSLPLYVSMPPPRPMPKAAEVSSPSMPAPPPVVDVELVAWPEAVKSAGQSNSRDVRLRLQWARFEGMMKDVEYRVFMWTLTAEQKQRAINKRPFEARGRCTLPPIAGTRTIVETRDGQGSAILDDDGTQLDPVANAAGKEPSLASANTPSAVVEGMDDDLSKKSAATGVAVRHGEDAPQIIAMVRPFEPAPRSNAVRRMPKANRGAPQDETQTGKLVQTEVTVPLLPRGHGYVFGVEAKHSRGTAGNAGEWSPPLFSKFVDFDYAPRHLNIEVDARFGALLFKSATTASTNPHGEQQVMEVNAVSYADEHRDLPAAMGLLPQHDPWPLNSSPSRYLIRSKGKTTYADQLGVEGDALSTDHLPETRPHGDEFRED